MSTFKGCLEEEKFSFIAVDNFTIDVVNKASVFFLTHYHSDHYCGLRRYDNQDKTDVSNIFKNNPDKILYCSDITRRLFISDDSDRIPESQIIAVRVGECIVVTSPKRDECDPISVTVTIISSGHILGAVMLLFEHENDRALFTGDFRIYPDDIPKVNALHYRNKEVKQITHLYLDTTFGYSDYRTFPLRSEVASEAVTFISEWLRSGYVVHIDLPYQFAFERFLLDLSKGLNRKITVDPDIYNSCYSYIPEFDDFLCTINSDCDEEKHLIHAFIKKWGEYSCILCSKYKKVKVIRPCAKFFNNTVAASGPMHTNFTYGYETVRFAYSSHCSYEELKAFVQYLQPKKLTTIVKHKQSELGRVKEDIFSLVSNSGKDKCSIGNDLQCLKSYKRSFPFQYDSSDESAEEYNCLPLDSPPR